MKIPEKEKFQKNPLTILQSEAVFSALKKLWENNHLNVKNPEEFVLDFFDFLKSNPKSSEKEIKKYYGQKLKEHSSDDIDTDFKQDMFLQLIEKDLEGIGTVLDFGCGKLAFLKNIAENNKEIKNFIGVDPKSSPALENLDPRIRFERSLDKIEATSVDLVIVKLVLHHLEEAEIIKVFKEIKRVLRPDGKLIIFEESFFDCHPGPAPASLAESRRGGDPGSNESLGLSQGVRFRVKPGMTDINNKIIADTKKYLDGSGLELAEEATSEFLKLSKEEKIQFLFLNDWLMNLQNKYMPWTLNYKSMEEWESIAGSAGFHLVESHFLGAIKKRKRKQGMTVVLKFAK